MGSRGSIIPFFKSLIKTNELPITDEKMSRFMITLEEGIDLVLEAFNDMVGGEIYVKKIPSMKVTDIARNIAPKASFKYIGVRPGEKIHEQMISIEDAPYTFEYQKYFKILPAINNWFKDINRIKDGKLVSNQFSYSSDKNNEWMKDEVFKFWLKSNWDKL